jgi:carbon storage regulator
MLVLTRRVEETVVINGNIRVKILGCKGNQVRIGFAAPKEVGIHREEAYEQMLRDQQLGTPTGQSNR